MGDLDVASGMAYVYGGKGGKSMPTVLTPDAIAGLTEFLEAEGRLGPAMPVFHNPAGQVMVPTTINEWIRVILRRAGLYQPRRNAHSFRRTMATLYLRRHPGDVLGLQRRRRHENLATTSLYVFLRPEELAPRVAQAFAPHNGGDHALR